MAAMPSCSELDVSRTTRDAADVSRSRMERMRRLWGPKPPYVPSAEDKATLFQQLYYGWIGDFVRQAAREELTESALLPPALGMRSYEVGWKFSLQMAAGMRRRHSWDPFLCSEVCYRGEESTLGRLRWVGYLSQPDEPHALLAGVEWEIPPSHRLAKSGVAPRMHDGVVHGERLFVPAQPGRSSCEPVENIKLLSANNNSNSNVPVPVAASFLCSLMKAHMYHVLVQFPGLLLADVCSVTLPILLEHYVKYLQEAGASWWQGLCLVLGIFVISALQSCANHKYDHMSMRAACVFESSSMALLFEKCLTIADKSLILPEMSIGRIMNMASTDIENISDFNWYMAEFLSAPLLLVICVGLLYRLVGWCAFAGTSALFFTLPVQILLSRWQSSIREKMAGIVDNRVRITNELFSGIRVVKFMAWEPLFLVKIEQTRAKELQCLKRIQCIDVGMALIDEATPTLIIAIVFILYQTTGNELTPETVFPGIALLNTLRMPFFLIPVIITSLVQCLISSRRLTAFLECDDKVPETYCISHLFTKGATAAFDGVTVSTFTAHPLPMYVTRTRSVLGRLRRLFRRRRVPEEEWEELSARPSESQAFPPSELDDINTPMKNAKKKEEKNYSVHHQLLPKELLKDVNVIIPDGKFTVIIGPTGSGKSTLLMTLLGEYEVTKGRVWATRSIAYVPQQPWIMNATLRENILLFSPEDPKRLKEAVRVCQLEADLGMLAGGMQTEIGEKGINLSGGQKARVSLARAVYSNRELYLLDDPLSALDAHVGERIVTDVLMGQLANKTRVLATHQLRVLSYADHVIALRHGRVVFCGNYQMYINSPVSRVLGEEMEHETAEHANGDNSNNQNDENGNNEHHSKGKINDCDGEKQICVEEHHDSTAHSSTVSDGQLMTVEEKAVGRIPWSTYMKYLKACGGLRVLAVVLALYLVQELATVASGVCLSAWSTLKFNLKAEQYLYIYIGIVLTSIFLLPIRTFVCYTAMRIGGQNLYRGLLHAAVVGKMTFFDTTPIGRLLNRFTRDVSSVDETLHGDFINVLGCIFSIFFTVVLMVIAQPYVILAVPPCCFVYYKLLVVYTAANREVRRLSSIARSPLFSLLDESVGGRSTIAAYGKPHVIMQEALRRVDIVYSSSYMRNIVNRWLGTRLEFVSSLIIATVALLGVIGTMLNFSTHSIGLVSLSLTMSLTLTDQINWFVRQVASLEADMNSVERILEYTENISKEDIPEISALVDELRAKNERMCDATATVVVEDGSGDKGSHRLDMTTTTTTTAGWLEFRDVEMRYRAGLPLVLNKVSFRIEPREKVGIVGRTGSGKSTLLLTFMRMVDICGGDIVVSGRPIRSYGLRELRQLFSMIPQDPVLFDGTVRSNLDPFLEATPAEVWRALELVGMRGRVEAEGGGIDGRVREGGANYSVGQRQLLCLARALLRRNSGFILMDEATANIDHALDRQIQQTIMTAFTAHTVITIAHRLHTVATYDKIIVMDHGVVAESGSPRELISDPSSKFMELVSALGEQEAADFMSAVGV